MEGLSYGLTSNPYTTTNDTTMGWTLTTRQLGTPNSAPTSVSVTSYSGSTPPAPWGANTTETGTGLTTYNVTGVPVAQGPPPPRKTQPET